MPCVVVYKWCILRYGLQIVYYIWFTIELFTLRYDLEFNCILFFMVYNKTIYGLQTKNVFYIMVYKRKMNDLESNSVLYTMIYKQSMYFTLWSTI